VLGGKKDYDLREEGGVGALRRKNGGIREANHRPQSAWRQQTENLPAEETTCAPQEKENKKEDSRTANLLRHCDAAFERGDEVYRGRGLANYNFKGGGDVNPPATLIVASRLRETAGNPSLPR